MKHTLATLAAILICFCAKAQISTYSAYQQSAADSLACSDSLAAKVMRVKMDSTLLGHSIFDVMPSHSKGDSGNVSIEQSREIASALNHKVENGTFTETPGYRIRIYFSNAQNAREGAAAAAHKFSEKFGTHSVYMNFVNPNFKVTVGDFRTRSEALALLETVKKDFPSAFIVKENVILTY